MSIEQVSFKGIDTILRSYGIKRKESTSTNPNGVDEFCNNISHLSVQNAKKALSVGTFIWNCFLLTYRQLASYYRCC